MASANGSVHLEVADGIATITLDRPPVNALVTETYLDLAAVFESVSTGAYSARAVVLTARGSYFCVGKDLKAASEETEEERNRAVRETFGAIRNCSLPVVAAVNGPALGAGLTFVFSCDLIVASAAATFGLPEIDAGLAGGFAILRRGLNQFQARRMYLTGEHLSAGELYRLGVILAVTSSEELLGEATALARRLAEKSPLAMRAAKWSANEVEKMIDFEQAYRVVESRLTVSLADTEDHKEAVAAFREHRKPRFLGR